MKPDTISKWHQIVKNKDLAALDQLLSDDVKFYSPVVHTAQEGKEITKKYLMAALSVLVNKNFNYTNEVYMEDRAILEFEVIIDDVYVNGVDIIHWDKKGQIVEFKVMIRPLKAIQLIMQKMAILLKAR